MTLFLLLHQNKNLCSLSTLPVASPSWSSSSTSLRPSSSAPPWRCLYPRWSRVCWTHPYQILGGSEGGEIASRLQDLRQPCFLHKSQLDMGTRVLSTLYTLLLERSNVAIFWTRKWFQCFEDWKLTQTWHAVTWALEQTPYWKTSNWLYTVLFIVHCIDFTPYWKTSNSAQCCDKSVQVTAVSFTWV